MLCLTGMGDMNVRYQHESSFGFLSAKLTELIIFLVCL